MAAAAAWMSELGPFAVVYCYRIYDDAGGISYPCLSALGTPMDIQFEGYIYC